MAATDADVDYVDRMLRLHPWSDASAIIAERAAYLAARTPAAPVTGSLEETPAVPGPAIARELRILPDRWHEQTYEVQVPVRSRVIREGTFFDRICRKAPWWFWWIGLVLLANVVRSVLTSRP